MINIFYSTPEYEKILKDKFNFAIKKKQEEIDENYRKTKKIQKFTAYGYIFRPERIFCVEEDGSVYYEEVILENRCPTEKVEGGKKYILDSNFDYAIMKFLEKHKTYKVIFSPDGHYGPTCCYCSSIGAIPARLESYNGEILVADDHSKYDICVA